MKPPVFLERLYGIPDSKPGTGNKLEVVNILFKSNIDRQWKYLAKKIYISTLFYCDESILINLVSK